MSQGDFDIHGLAQYLHLTVAQVSRLAERGRLPGRKVGGQWRFAHAEVHHWLEERIGLSDEQELVEVEDVLHRAEPSPSEAELSIAELIPREAIAIPLDARTRGSVIREMAKLAAKTGILWDASKMAEAVHARENLHPTALDTGVALLHPRRPMSSILSQPVIALGRTSQGIPFGGRHGALTDIFFLICSVDDGGHLRVLARLSRIITDSDLLGLIRTSESAPVVHEAIEQVEQHLPT